MDQRTKDDLLASMLFYSAYDPKEYWWKEMELKDKPELCLTTREKETLGKINERKDAISELVCKGGFLPRSYFDVSTSHLYVNSYQLSLRMNKDFSPFGEDGVSTYAGEKEKIIRKAIIGPIAVKKKVRYRVYKLNEEVIEFIKRLKSLLETAGCDRIKFSIGEYGRIISPGNYMMYNYNSLDETDYTTESRGGNYSAIQVNCEFPEGEKYRENIKRILLEEFGIDL